MPGSKSDLGSIAQMKQLLQEQFADTVDLQVNTLQFGAQEGLVVFLKTMVDSQLLTEMVLEPMLAEINQELPAMDADLWRQRLNKRFLAAQHSFVQSEQEVISKILSGHILICLEQIEAPLAIQIKTSEQRSIEEPSTQTIVRGPKDGFNESMETNMSLIRRRVRNASLRFESFILGQNTSTSVNIAYMKGMANDKVVEEVRNRLRSLTASSILDTGQIEEYITDKTLTPFPLVFSSERPDTISAHLLSGKVALLIDGSPFVISMPSLFKDFLTVPEDYYQPFMLSSLIRLLRYFSFLISLLLPSLYVAVITYHHEMIPTVLLISIISQREGIPFPAVVEALLMEISFEILREAGIRMPRAVGGTISIVGGLVIGQAAVEAGIVSNFMVIIVALTAISSFVSPVYSFATSARLLRFLFIIMASVFGLYGVLLGVIMMIAHLASLRSFGVPYLSPFGPLRIQDQKDALVRLPNWLLNQLPSKQKTSQRKASNQAKGEIEP